MPGLSSAGERDLWATSFGDLACCKLECRLCAYPGDTSAFWTPPEYWDADIALEMSDTPNVWTDGSREDFSSTGGFEVACACACVYASAPESAFEGSVWGVAEEYGDARLERCRPFMLVLEVLQTVQRVEFWVPVLLCSPTGLVIQALTTSMLLGPVGGCWIVAVWSNLCL